MPRLTDHQIRDVECSALEFAGRGTDEAVLLTLAVNRLAVDHDDADLTGPEFAARVQGSHQILVVARDRAELSTGLVSTSPGEPLMPAAFVGHGSPMNALEVNRYTAAWRRFGATVPRPRVILVVSAHWYINATAVTAMPKPRTIHDFYGFPDELFDVQAPAEAGRLTDHEDFRLAVPTPDHFIPSLYFAGLAADADETPRVLVDGYTYGSLSMTSYTLGADIAAAEPDQRGAPSRSPEIPAGQTNI